MWCTSCAADNQIITKMLKLEMNRCNWAWIQSTNFWTADSSNIETFPWNIYQLVLAINIKNIQFTKKSCKLFRETLAVAIEVHLQVFGRIVRGSLGKRKQQRRQSNYGNKWENKTEKMMPQTTTDENGKLASRKKVITANCNTLKALKTIKSIQWI